MKRILVLLVIIINVYGYSQSINNPFEIYESFFVKVDRHSGTPPSGKIFNKFDNGGNLVENIFYSWNSNQQNFTYQQKDEYSYDDNNKLIQRISYNWNTGYQTFIPRNKVQYQYDINGKQTRWENFIFKINLGSYVHDFKNEMSYNEIGKVQYDVHSQWDSGNQSYTYYSKKEYIYNELDEIQIKILNLWDINSQSFQPSVKYEFHYNQDSNLILEQTFVWNNNSQSWDGIGRKIEYDYDNNGNLSSKIEYSWSNNSESFYRNSKEEYVNDENGNILIHTYFSPDYFQNFIPSYKIENTYDSNNNKTKILEYRWVPNIGSYKLEIKEEYSFDDNNFESSRIFHIEKDNNVTPKIRMDLSTISETETNLVREGITFEYDTNSNTWNELEGEEFKSYWYYTKTQSLSTNSVETNSFSIYPNPTSNSLHINSSESLSNTLFELYDLKGSKILSNPFKLTEPIDVSGLQPSMYIYNVKDGSEVKQSGKILIE